MEYLNRVLVKKAFRECKKAANLDYSYSRGLGDCMSCTNSLLIKKHGIWSNGIWLKWFPSGMNKSSWETQKSAYIVHELKAEQAKIVKDVLSKYFEFEWDGDHGVCMRILPKKEETKNPKPKIVIEMKGPMGNIYAIIAEAKNALFSIGNKEAANKIFAEVTNSAKSYEEALGIVRKYVNLVEA